MSEPQTENQSAQIFKASCALSMVIVTFRPIFARTNAHKFSIKIMSLMIWNRLSLGIRTEASLSLFKSKVHSFLSDTSGTDLNLRVLKYGSD